MGNETRPKIIMKPIITKMLCSGVLLLSFFTAFAESITYDGIVYNILSEDEKTVEVGCNDSSSIAGDVTIPETINYNGSDYKVNSIGKNAFFNCSSITSINIPSSVTSIGNYALYGCSALSSIDIPTSVTAIGESVFKNCTSLTAFELPNSITSISYGMFSGCSALKSIVIPNSVTSIDWDAFSDCSALSSIELPNSVNSIGVAFRNCNSLSSINIPSSVSDINRCAFDDCMSLREINVNEENQNYFSADGVLCSKVNATLVRCPTAKAGEFTIPSSVTSIGRSSFYDCSLLTSLVIPASVTSIDVMAFEKCGLKKIYCHSTQPFEFHDSFYYNYDITVYVPTGYATAYKAVAPWNKLNIIEMDYSGVNDINDESDFNVSVNEGAIVVNGIHGELQVNVYDISGKKVYSGFSGYINGLKRGMYIVQVANKSIKVMLDQ